MRLCNQTPTICWRSNKIKGNFQGIQDLFAGCHEVNFRDVPHDYEKTVNKDHGRIEIRECWTLADPKFLDFLRQRETWIDL